MGEYNGWPNYETWCINLWIGNEEATYLRWRSEARKVVKRARNGGMPQIGRGIWSQQEAAKYTLADQLKAELEEAMPLKDAGFWTDLLRSALSEVDWGRTAEAVLEGEGYEELSGECVKA